MDREIVKLIYRKFIRRGPSATAQRIKYKLAPYKNIDQNFWVVYHKKNGESKALVPMNSSFCAYVATEGLKVENDGYHADISFDMDRIRDFEHIMIISAQEPNIGKGWYQYGIDVDMSMNGSDPSSFQRFNEPSGLKIYPVFLELVNPVGFSSLLEAQRHTKLASFDMYDQLLEHYGYDPNEIMGGF